MEADAVKHDNLSADGLTIRVHLFNVVINLLDKPLAAVGLRLTANNTLSLLLFIGLIG